MNTLGNWAIVITMLITMAVSVVGVGVWAGSVDAENEKGIAVLNSRMERVEADIAEIKWDVKELLRRSGTD